MISLNNRTMCENCFSHISTELCPYCGYSKTDGSKTPNLLTPGTVLLGKYIIGKAIGVGGFGITYLGYDAISAKKIAIKEYFPQSLVYRGTDSQTVSVASMDNKDALTKGKEKFYDEAKLISRFNGNPNIVSVYEFFYENNTAYFVMEYLKGTDLKHYIADKGGRISAGEVLTILNDVTSALMVAHSANVLHRDISPDNIFLCEDDSIKLIDFGAARQYSNEQSKSMSVIVKQGFAPLEQYQKRGKQGPWTDIYALGATAYYGLTGKLLDDPISRLESDIFPGFEELGIDENLYAIIMKCIKLPIPERYANMFELRSDLNALKIEPLPLDIPKKQGAEPIEEIPPIPVGVTIRSIDTPARSITKTMITEPAVTEEIIEPEELPVTVEPVVTGEIIEPVVSEKLTKPEKLTAAVETTELEKLAATVETTEPEKLPVTVEPVVAEEIVEPVESKELTEPEKSVATEELAEPEESAATLESAVATESEEFLKMAETEKKPVTRKNLPVKKLAIAASAAVVVIGGAIAMTIGGGRTTPSEGNLTPTASASGANDREAASLTETPESTGMPTPTQAPVLTENPTLLPALEATAEELEDEAQKYYEAGEYKKARELYLKAANAGDSNAMNMLGIMYRDGQGCVKNPNRAYGWFKKAYEAGNANGICNYGYCYYTGIYVSVDDMEAVRLFKEAAAAGDALAYGLLGECYYFGYGTTQDYVTAFKYLKKAYENENYNQANLFGDCYLSALGTSRDYELAIAAYKAYISAVGENGGVENNIGYAYEQLGNELAAFRAYQRAADAGNGMGMANLGRCHFIGYGTEISKNKARKYWEKAVEYGYTEAQKYLDEHF